MDFPNAQGFVGPHGLSTNAHGRAYLSGSALSFSEKVTICSACLKVRESTNNARSRPYIDDTTIKCGVRKTGRGRERGRFINNSDVNDKRVDEGNMTNDVIVV